MRAAFHHFWQRACDLLLQRSTRLGHLERALAELQQGQQRLGSDVSALQVKGKFWDATEQDVQVLFPQVMNGQCGSAEALRVIEELRQSIRKTNREVQSKR
jgi:hypothetical protein